VAWRRRHWFEHNDSAFAPVALRETVIETLGRTLAWGRVLRSLAPPFARFLERAGTSQVLDLCAGTGRPAAILGTELERAGHAPPQFLLTDLQPHPETWTALRDQHPTWIDFVPDPVDATHIPDAIGHGRARVIVNSFHHFEPALAASILRGACANAPGVFIAEGFERSPLGFLPFALLGMPALLVNPILAPRRKLEKALLTWASPIALAVSAWDGVVSTLRVYTEAELRAMVAPLGDAFEWEYGTYEFFPGGRGYYFSGLPRR